MSESKFKDCVFTNKDGSRIYTTNEAEFLELFDRFNTLTSKDDENAQWLRFAE